jgi:hypothetical protein
MEPFTQDDALKEEFLSETRSLWDATHTDKYNGRILGNLGGEASREEAAMM